jgi:hypothetical protein
LAFICPSISKQVRHILHLANAEDALIMSRMVYIVALAVVLVIFTCSSVRFAKLLLSVKIFINFIINLEQMPNSSGPVSAASGTKHPFAAFGERSNRRVDSEEERRSAANSPTDY